MSAIQSGESVGVVEVTPSGIAVYFASKPKRVYKIRKPSTLDLAPDVLAAEAQDDPHNEWREIPSVTTVLGVLDKSGPLVWWAQRVGIEGVIELNKRNILVAADFEPEQWGKPDAWDAQGIVDVLVREKLSTNHVRDRAGDRGQAVHDALENWARYGHRPDPSIYPEEQEGYVRGLLAFLDDVPSAEPEGAEVLVASAKYGYAGRYDLRLRTSEEHEVVVHRTATKVHKRKLAPGRLLADLKTSKAIYASHARQLEAYEEASIESGYEPTDGRGILLVAPDGTYQFKRSWATFEDFRVVLDVWNSEQEMKARK